MSWNVYLDYSYKYLFLLATRRFRDQVKLCQSSLYAIRNTHFRVASSYYFRLRLIKNIGKKFASGIIGKITENNNKNFFFDESYLRIMWIFQFRFTKVFIFHWVYLQIFSRSELSENQTLAKSKAMRYQVLNTVMSSFCRDQHSK